VIVPSSMNVLTECTAVFGSTSCEPESVRQRGNSAENTHVLTIDGNVQFGNLEVIRE